MKSERYRFRDGQTYSVGDFVLWGLLQERFYPNWHKKEFIPKIWEMEWHDMGCPDHRLKLARKERRIALLVRGAMLPNAPSDTWE
jgi:hypothetical protein